MHVPPEDIVVFPGPGRDGVSSAKISAYLSAKAHIDRRSIVPSSFRRTLNRWMRNRANHLLRNAAAKSRLDDFEMPRLRRNAAWEYF